MLHSGLYHFNILCDVYAQIASVAHTKEICTHMRYEIQMFLLFLWID